jgi:hypothetical protein
LLINDVTIPDFTQPLSQVSINGFPIFFREYVLKSGQTLYVPRGISRQIDVKAWRIYFSEANGIQKDVVYDNDHTPLESLGEAWSSMVSMMLNCTSILRMDRRTRVPGPGRTPEMDPGITGVQIVRRTIEDRKVIEVHTKQSLESDDEINRHRQYYVGGISEVRFFDDPERWQVEFERMVIRAVAVRRYFQSLVARSERPDEIITFDDVPNPVRLQPYSMPKIRLDDLFASYVSIYDPAQTDNSNEADVLLAVMLQQNDLLSPLANTRLNGFSIRFNRTIIDNIPVFLPTGLYRAPGEWRLRVSHKGGVFADSIPDDPGQAHPIESLKESWQYLVSTYRALTPPPVKIKKVGDPLINTGVEGVNFLISGRASKLNPGCQAWSINLRHMQRGPGGQLRTFSVGYWNERTLERESLSFALRKASAIASYRSYLQYIEDKKEVRFISPEEAIPESYWPDAPIYDLSTEDILEYIRKKQKSDVHIEPDPFRIRTGLKGVSVNVNAKEQKGNAIRWSVQVIVRFPWKSKKQYFTVSTSPIGRITQQWLDEKVSDAIAMRLYLNDIHAKDLPRVDHLLVSDVPSHFRDQASTSQAKISDLRSVIEQKSQKYET